MYPQTQSGLSADRGGPDTLPLEAATSMDDKASCSHGVASKPWRVRSGQSRAMSTGHVAVLITWCVFDPNTSRSNARRP